MHWANQPGAQMTNQIQTLWKHNRMTVMCNYFPYYDIDNRYVPIWFWDDIYFNLYGSVLIVAGQSAIFNILLYSTFTLSRFPKLFIMHSSIFLMQQMLLGSAIINTDMMVYSWIISIILDLRKHPHPLYRRICMNIMRNHQCIKKTYFEIMRKHKDHRVNLNLSKLQVMSMHISKFRNSSK